MVPRSRSSQVRENVDAPLSSAGATALYPTMKDSGVEWLGWVPAHWEVRRLRTIAEMRVSNVDKHSRDGERPIRLCNYVDVYNADRIRTGMPLMAATAVSAEIERFRLHPDDVLITKDSEAWNDIGVPALVETAADNTICGYHLALLRPFSGCVSGGFLFRAVESSAVAQQFHVRANGVTRYGLTHNAIKAVWLPLPPPPEQAAIVRFLDHADRRIRRYIRAREKLIGAASRVDQSTALIGEYRTRLIADVVTGKLDVREAAAKLPEMDPLATEQDPDDDFNQHPSSGASKHEEEGGPARDVVDAERSDAAVRKAMAKGR